MLKTSKNGFITTKYRNILNKKMNKYTHREN